MRRVKLVDRDEDALQIYGEIEEVIKLQETNRNVVLGIDAPLQGNRKIPIGRVKVRRFCEERLNAGRQAIDRAMGGAKGWQPTIQPGIPLARRVQRLLQLLENGLGILPWTSEAAGIPRVAIECFPAEAIWAAKRLGGYQEHQHATEVKSYKKQQGNTLSAGVVNHIVSRVLVGAFEKPSGVPDQWPGMVKQLIAQMLEREDWVHDNGYRGGKLLDDVIDSAICFVTALSYAHGHAHVWQDPGHPEDGHIIGVGPMQELVFA